MKSEFYSQKITTDRLEFFELKNYPKALRFEKRTNGNLVAEGIVRRGPIEEQWTAGVNLIDFLQSYDQNNRESLRTNSRYWFVPIKALSTTDDLFEYHDDKIFHAEDPDWIPICQSDYDHRIWDLNGQPIFAPMELKIWGTEFNLEKVKAHLTDHPAVISFEIEFNQVRQNWGISGKYQGKLVLDLTKLSIVEQLKTASNIHFDSWCPSPPVAHRTWLENNVVRNLHGNEWDCLGLAQFKINKKY